MEIVLACNIFLNLLILVILAEWTSTSFGVALDETGG